MYACVCVCVYTHTYMPYLYPLICWLLLYLAIVNNAAVNTGVHVSFEISVLFSFNIQPGVELLDHMVILFLVF